MIGLATSRMRTSSSLVKAFMLPPYGITAPFWR